MGQRAMIAMMLIAGPELLIADEPTSALDVTVQLDVLGILDRLVADRGMGLIFISHDLQLVSSFCDRVIVMYAGKDRRAVAGLGTFASASIPIRKACSTACRRSAPTAIPCRCLTASRSGRLDRRALRPRASTSSSMGSARLKGVSLDVQPGESFGLVGESGSGKSTLLRAVAGLAPVSAGTIAAWQDARPAPRQGLLPLGADGVPGPLWLAASAPDRRPAAAGAAGDPWPRRRRAAHPAGARRSRARFRLPLPLFAPAFRRPAPARGDRPRPDPRSRRSCCSTSRPRRSTPRCRPKCSTCSNRSAATAS